MVRGFEPTRLTNESHWGAADVLSQMVPAYVEAVLESQHKTQHGFTLQDAVDMVLMLDQLIFDSESALLEGVYSHQRRDTQQALNQKGLKQVIEEYIVMWMIDPNPRERDMLMADQTLREKAVPQYKDLMKFVEGRIKTFKYSRRQHHPAGVTWKKGAGSDVWAMHYSFNDAHQIVGGITRTFQSFWQSECDSMKSALVGMDSHGTGRVPLAKFYNTAINTDWRFGESEAYLRELGALDETSTWLGAQVLIPNYLQATSNCIISTSHYLVCCVNECEELMGEIETAIDSATAPTWIIFDVVGRMSSPTTLDDDEPAHLTAQLKLQLEAVARNHGGTVPLHGRLFAQWLHYVFPRECPFPHKVGAVASDAPLRLGHEHIATQADMKRLASNASSLAIPDSVGKEELQWMAQWSPDEELMVDYSSELGSTVHRNLLLIFGFLFAVCGLWGGAVGRSSNKIINAGASPGAVSHAHWV